MMEKLFICSSSAHLLFAEVLFSLSKMMFVISNELLSFHHVRKLSVNSMNILMLQNLFKLAQSGSKKC